MNIRTLFPIILAASLTVLPGCDTIKNIFHKTDSQISKIEDSLQWIYGGYNGSKDTCAGDLITGLSVSPKGMTYSWTISDEEAVRLLGSNSRTDADLLACLFVRTQSGEIVGGKFEWISVSRKSREFGNIFSGYRGWTLANVPNPTEAYFCIIHPKKHVRTNFISATWKR